MGLFGSARKRDAALADPQMYMPATEAPPIPEAASIAPQGMGTFNLAPVGQIKPHVGAFDRGGMGWQILGAIGDGLSQMGGYGAPFAQARNQMRQQQLEEAQWTRRQASELADKKSMYDYELAHPKPPAPNDTERDFNLLVSLYGRDKALQMYQQHYNAPHYYVDSATGQPMMVGGPMPQQQSFDALPPGYTVRTPGGPTPPASGNFPRR